jgi:hypothetical protein
MTKAEAERIAGELLAALGAVDEMVGELMIPCPSCKGTGVGRTGPDPDWCGQCGGPGQVYDQERDERLRIEAVATSLREVAEREYQRGVEDAAKDGHVDDAVGGAVGKLRQDLRDALLAQIGGEK